MFFVEILMFCKLKISHALILTFWLKEVEDFLCFQVESLCFVSSKVKDFACLNLHFLAKTSSGFPMFFARNLMFCVLKISHVRSFTFWLKGVKDFPCQLHDPFKTLFHNLCFFSLNHCLLMLFKTDMLEIKKLHLKFQCYMSEIKKIRSLKNNLISL